MRSVIVSFLLTLRASLRDRAALQLEILALRHQLQVVEPITAASDCGSPMRTGMLWVWLSRRLGRMAGRPRDRQARDGPRLAPPRLPALLDVEEPTPNGSTRACLPDVRHLIRTMAEANPLWGAPRIHGELLKLGIDVSQATVAKYMPRHRRPPSQTWRTFLTNHVGQIAAADFFVVPTATCRLLFVLVILAHERRRVVHIAVTAHPTAAWTAQQFREAFPGTRSRAISFAIVIRFRGIGATATGMGIHEECSPRHVHRGRTRMRSA